MAHLKTTLEIPDALYRRLKTAAAEQGSSVRALVNQAISDLLRKPSAMATAGPAWRRGFGKLGHLHAETKRIQGVIGKEFSTVDPEDWK
jgi:predicted transcriptional regulator